MKKSLLALALAVTFQQSAVAAQAITDSTRQVVINATYLGQDDNNVYMQADSGEAVVVPVRYVRHRSGAGQTHVGCITYAYSGRTQCWLEPGPAFNMPDLSCANKKEKCALPGGDPFEL